MGRTECTILGFVASPIGCVSCVLVRVSAVYRLWRQLVPSPRGKVAYSVSKLRCSITQDTNAACPRNIPVFMHAEDCVLVEDDDWAPCAVVRLRIADPLRIKCWPTQRFFFVPMVRLWLPRKERQRGREGGPESQSKSSFPALQTRTCSATRWGTRPDGTTQKKL